MAAKLQHPILLCNDISPKSLIDICVDDENCLLITCKSFIKRFCLSDRRQVNSWITNSWHPFTTGALRDHHSNKITCVISNSLLCQWDLEEINIENIKKNSFKSGIHKLVSHEDEIYVVYKCGFIETLSAALKSRKDEKRKILQEDERILSIAIITDQNVSKPIILVEKEGGSIWLCKFTFGSQIAQFSLNVHLTNHYMIGSSILSTGHLLTAWSDGNLYSMNTLDPDSTPNPGAMQGSLSFFKKTKNLKIIELSKSHIVLQGMDSSEDGGLVVLWDIKFGVNVSSKPMKMYRDPPLAWSVESGIVLADGGTLAYIPVMLAPSTVASMFASRIGVAENCDQCIGWNSLNSTSSTDHISVVAEEAQMTIYSNKSSALADVMKSTTPGAASEDTVVRLVVSHLIEKRNLELIIECISAYSFIPESCIVSILKFLLDIKNEHFENSKSPKSKEIIDKELTSRNEMNSGVSERLNCSPYNTEDIEEESGVQDISSVFSEKKRKLINRVLRLPFTEKQLTVHLHQLDFNSSWDLVQYLHHLIASGKAKIVEDPDDEFPSVDTTGLWLSLVLDSNYHQLVMTSETKIQRRLLNFEKDISNLKEFLEASHSIDPLVERVMHSKDMPVTHSDAPYSIERIVLR